MKSIKFKIVTLTICSVFLVSLVISLVVIMFSREVFEDISVEKAKAYTTMFALEFDRQLVDVKNTAIEAEMIVESMIDVKQVSREGYLDEFELEMIPSIKALALQGEKTMSAYVFLDPSLDGSVHDVWFTDLNHTGNVVRQEEFPKTFYEKAGIGDEWYTVPKETMKPYWTKVYNGSVKQDEHILYISHTRPVIADGQFLGVVGSDYHFMTMLKEIEHFKLYENGYAVILDETGRILAHPSEPTGSSLLYDYEGRYTWIQETIASSSSGIIEYQWIDGEDKFMVFETIENGLKFAIAIEKDEVFRWFYNLQHGLIVVSIVVVLIVLILGLQLSKRITSPMDELTDFLALMNTGNYDQKMDILCYDDEVGELAAGVEIMRNQLNNSELELQNHSKKLEVLVKERSKSLLQSHQQLEDAILKSEIQGFDLIKVNDSLQEVMKEMIETRQQLIGAEKMTSESTLLFQIAKDFSKPMDAFKEILNDLMMLRQTDEKAFIDVFDEAYEQLMKHLNMMTCIAEQFKAFDCEKMSVKTHFNVRHMIEFVAQTLEFNDNVTIEILCNPELIIFEDEAQLTTVIHHLLDNISKHAFLEDDKGMVVIDVDIKDELVISIKDNGVGLGDKLSTIFKPVHDDPEKKGYGLMIVHMIVTSFLEGQISCVSHEDFGTEFRMGIGIKEEV